MTQDQKVLCGAGTVTVVFERIAERFEVIIFLDLDDESCMPIIVCKYHPVLAENILRQIVCYSIFHTLLLFRLPTS